MMKNAKDEDRKTQEQNWDDSKLQEYLLSSLWDADAAMYIMSGRDFFNGGKPLDPKALRFSHYANHEIFSDDKLTCDEAERLKRIWSREPVEIKAESHSPAFFIKWALSKNHRPVWLDWAIEQNLNKPADDQPPGITDGMVTITKLAITAAWEIEGEIGRKAAAKEVIKRLQEWVTSKRYAELIEIIPHGVKWMTTAPDDKPYDIDACRATLKSWRKSLG